MLVHYDPRTRLVTIKDTARPENEPDTILRIDRYATGEGRDAHLVRNNQPVNLAMLILGHPRVLAGSAYAPNQRPVASCYIVLLIL